MGVDVNQALEPYAHDQTEYARAFGTFLSHTNQKAKAIGWLTDFVGRLRSRGLFVDAGAGEGSTTTVLAGLFERTIAIEPNSALRAELVRRCPKAEIVALPIREVQIAYSADFVLCSHVLYYVPQADWTDTLERLASWVGPNGAAVVLLANSDADVILLPRAFFGANFNLAQAAQEFKARHPGWDVLMSTLNCEIVVEDLESACMLTRFFLSDYPDWGNKVTLRRVQEYVLSHFAGPRGYRMSCDQDVLLVRPR